MSKHPTPHDTTEERQLFASLDPASRYLMRGAKLDPLSRWMEKQSPRTRQVIAAGEILTEQQDRSRRR